MGQRVPTAALRRANAALVVGECGACSHAAALRAAALRAVALRRRRAVAPGARPRGRCRRPPPPPPPPRPECCHRPLRVDSDGDAAPLGGTAADGAPGGETTTSTATAMAGWMLAQSWHTLRRAAMADFLWALGVLLKVSNDVLHKDILP